MAVSLTDVRELMTWLHNQHFAPGSTQANLGVLADTIASAKASVAGGKFSVTLGQLSPITFSLNSVFGIQTADGILVTDYSLFLRDFCLALVGPTIGQQPKQDPYAIADLVRMATLRFFSGGSTGGAIYDTYKWQISPAWLPIPEAQPLTVLSSQIDSPIARTLSTIYPLANASQRDLQKALNASVDPSFSLLAMAGTTMITSGVAQTARVRGGAMGNWKPTLVYSGNSADTDVVTRPGTWVADNTQSDWRSDMYEQLLNGGYLISSLQLPRLFTHPSLLYRVSFEGTLIWFKGVAKDYALTGLLQADVTAILANPLGYKMGWLDDFRGIPLPDAVTATALTVSPLAYTGMAPTVKGSAAFPAQPSLALTPGRRAWINSDPTIPPSGAWLVTTQCNVMMKPWLEAVQTGLYSTLLAITT